MLYIITYVLYIYYIKPLKSIYIKISTHSFSFSFFLSLFFYRWKRQPRLLHSGQINSNTMWSTSTNHQTVNVQSLAMTCNAVHWVASTVASSKRKLWQPNLISFNDNVAVHTDNIETETTISQGFSKTFYIVPWHSRQRSFGLKNGKCSYNLPGICMQTMTIQGPASM